jgi:hypothetical protein
VRKEDLKNQNSIRLEKSKFQKQKTKKVRKEDSPVRVAVRKEDLKRKIQLQTIKKWGKPVARAGSSAQRRPSLYC